MSSLFLIPARAGSKGLPGKNYKPLAGKPLILYSLEVARELADDKDICVSTNDKNVVECLKAEGYNVPFIRPDELATDFAGSREVMLHALEHYHSMGRNIERLILLQPTSPFRTARHVQEAISLFAEPVDMVVSVKETKSNPYYVLMEENEDGWLFKSKGFNFLRRQDVPKVYEFNGAIYIINVESLKKKPLPEFKHVRKYVMDEESSVDIDSALDWLLAEVLANKYKTT
jgi:CMP-N,N'-diacetyllegionaminic acid synthase